MIAEETIKLLGTAKQSLKEQVPVLTKINPQISKSLEENALMIIEAYSMAIEALEEVEQYRALGTVEELKKAKEKQIAKKPDFEGYGYDCRGTLVYDTWICPNCEADYEVDYEEYECCPKCGQAIDWSEGE